MSDLLDDILPAPHVDVDFRIPYTIIVNFAPDEFVAVEQLAVLRKTDPVHLVMDLVREALPHPNGSAYPVQCFGCSKQVVVKRRPNPGRRSWCDTCKAAGEPAAQRARDYRARKEANL